MSTTNTLWLFQYSQTLNRDGIDVTEIFKSWVKGLTLWLSKDCIITTEVMLIFCRHRQNQTSYDIFLSQIISEKFSLATYIVPTQSNNKWNLAFLIRRFDLTPAEDPREAYKTIICHTIWLCWIYKIYVANL